MNIPGFPPSALIIVGLIIFLAALVKGVAGMGFPLIAVPLVANVTGPHAAVIIVAVPTVVSNAYMVLQGGGSTARLRQFVWLGVGLILGAVAGARLMHLMNTRVLALILGGLAVGYAGASLIQIPLRIPFAAQPAMGAGIGAAAGLLGGSTTIYAPLLAAYLDSMRLAKDEFVFWITALFLVGTSAQVVTYIQLGIYRGALLWAPLLLCVPMLAGTWMGIRLRERLSHDRFRTFVLLLVLASGFNLLGRALWR